MPEPRANPLLPLLLQVIPILVFLVVDALWQDALWAIAAALAFVCFQSALTWRRQRRLDPFLLLDLLLIGGLGGASLISRDELFFKLKPALMEGILVPYLLFLALSGAATLQRYLERFSLGRTPTPATLPLLRRLLGLMAALVALHAGLTVVAALCWTRQTWGWISGPGFYLLLLPLLGWSLVMRFRLRRQLARSVSEPREADPQPPAAPPSSVAPGSPPRSRRQRRGAPSRRKRPGRGR